MAGCRRLPAVLYFRQEEVMDDKERKEARKRAAQAARKLARWERIDAVLGLVPDPRCLPVSLKG